MSYDDKLKRIYQKYKRIAIGPVMNMAGIYHPFFRRKRVSPTEKKGGFIYMTKMQGGTDNEKMSGRRGK
jgi:hypothetical protein